MSSTEHNILSSYREQLIEHLFIGELMKTLWLKGHYVEVSKPQVDDSGYDLILECNGIIRHVQLKASHQESSTATAKVNVKLAEKPSGCVVWIRFDQKTMNLGPFLWFGSSPGQPLPDLTGFKTVKHTKANSKGEKTERPNIKEIPKGKFEVVESILELATKLFGIT
ncbi:MAG: hypothetical protein IMX05_09600 [Hydrogenibacillus schlegelii]|nr:hypothetical protein [Hydrogenibacillus schlegelii]